MRAAAPAKSPSPCRSVMPAALATWNAPGESYPDTYVPSSCDSVVMRWFAMPPDETRRIPGRGLSDDECSGSGGPQELIVDDLDRDGRFVMGLSVKLK